VNECPARGNPSPGSRGGPGEIPVQFDGWRLAGYKRSISEPTPEEGGLDIILQLVLNGLAVGCIYGLVALGFVLIYKATELVNFAQGDLLMLGAFTCYIFVVWYGVGYWVAFAAAVAVVGLFGAALDSMVLRRVLGQPQFAVVMLTIGLA